MSFIVVIFFFFFFFKQKTAYEMRISDWSSDVCSSDLGGRLDILVNNAGVTRDNLAMRMKDDEWDQVIRVNLEAAFRLARAATRPMMKARFGRIISITSVVGQTGNPGQVNYATSQAGRSEEQPSALQSLMRISYATIR